MSGATELASAFGAVLAVLKRTQQGSSSTTIMLPWDEDGSSATSIVCQVSDCSKTLKELAEVLAHLRSGSSSRISRHMKMQDRGKQIDRLSARIKTHTDSLQMSLQIVTIKISHATPGFLLGPLNGALQDIRSRLARIEDERHRSPDGYNLKEDDEDPLVELARDALRSGTTLYNASVAESSIGADSMMGGEKAAHIGKWIRETGDAAQNTYVAPDDRSRLTPGSGSVKAQNTHTSVEAAISEAYSSQAASKAGSFSRDDSQFQLPPVPEEKPAPTVKPSDLRRLPTDFSRPLNQWDRSEVVSFFGIKPDGRWDVEICTGIKTTSEQLRSILKNAVSKQVFDLVRKRNMLSLHLAVLFQDLHLVQFLLQGRILPKPLCPGL